MDMQVPGVSESSPISRVREMEVCDDHFFFVPESYRRALVWQLHCHTRGQYNGRPNSRQELLG